MLMVNQLVGFGAFTSGGTPALIDRTVGTNIGNMTSSGGLAAAFDGTTAQASGSGAFAVSVRQYCGKNYSAVYAGGVQFHSAVVYGSNDAGFQGGTPSITLKIWGKNGSDPGSATDGTTLGTLTFTDTADESAGRSITSTDTSNFWTRIWVTIEDGSATNDGRYLAELAITGVTA